MHEIYKWPSIDGEQSNDAAKTPSSGAPDAFTVIGAAVASAQKHAFLDMNESLATSTQAPQPSEESRQRAAEELAQAVSAAKEEGRQSAQLETQDALARLRDENERLARQIEEQREALKAHGESTAMLGEDLFGALLSRIAQGRVRMDIDAWMSARQMLLSKLDPQRAIEIMVGAGEGRELAQALSTPNGESGCAVSVVESPELPPGEMRASDGKQTWSVSAADLAQAIADSLAIPLRGDAHG